MNEEAVNTSWFGILFLGCMILLMWSLPRRYAVVPLFITTCYIPLGQSFLVSGLNLQFFRILLLAGWIRAFLRGEHCVIRWGRVDHLFGWWLFVTLVFGLFTQPSDFEARLVNRVGQVFNAAAAYYLIRCWVRNLDDITNVIRTLALIIVPLAGLMLVEKYTSRNVFSFLGGVPEFTTERDGRLRCQGAFRHPILAGTYGATLFPLFVALWRANRGMRTRAALGIACSTVVTVAASSSGAALAYLSACAGSCLWPFRKRMHHFRWMFLTVLAALTLIMNAPVWYLFARLSDVVGGTGWYRSFLIEQAVRHFDEWYLTGTCYTAHWAPGGEVPAGNPENTDIVNHYVAEGLDGGILKLCLFVLIIVQCFRTIGVLIRRESALPPGSRHIVWGLGVCLAAHCISFFSVVYFDQIIVMWYWILAATAALHGPVFRQIAESEQSDMIPAPYPTPRPVLAYFSSRAL